MTTKTTKPITTTRRKLLAVRGGHGASLWLQNGAVYLCRTATTSTFEHVCSLDTFTNSKDNLIRDGWEIK